MFLSVGLAPHDVRSVCREVTSSIGNDRWLTCGVEGEINMGDAAVRGEKVHYGRREGWTLLPSGYCSSDFWIGICVQGAAIVVEIESS